MSKWANGQMGKLTVYLLACLLVIFCLAGCSPLVSNEQPASTTWLSLAAGKIIGQTFVADYDGLSAIQVYLAPQNPGSGEIVLHLRSDAQATVDIATSNMTIQTITGAGFYGFFFTPQSTSRRGYFYTFLEIRGNGSVQVGSATGDTYLSGALYQNHTPVDAQLTFRLIYSLRRAGLGFVREVVIWGGILTVGLFLFVLPGWGLLSLLLHGWDGLYWGEKLGLATGFSLALYPLLMLLTDLFELHLGPIYAWLPPLTGLSIIIWRARVGGWNAGRLKVCNFQLSILNLQRTFPSLALLIILALIFASRFWAVRSLEAPQWGDSVQHTTMTQLILDNKGLFKSWEPYAPYGSLTVQFGFSVFAAIFTWITGLSSVKATLIVGQIINGLAVLTIYPLATRLSRRDYRASGKHATTGSRWAGTGAVLVAGLLSTRPAYYVNWGRYAQLAGQAILPVALWMVWEALAGERRKDENGSRPLAISYQISIISLSALILAGMMLTYYRMPFYYATFVLALLIGWGLPEWRLKGRIWAGKLGILLGVAVIAGLFLLPWGVRLLGGSLANAVEGGVTSGSPVKAVLADYRWWGEIFTHVSKALVIVALTGLAWSLIRKRWIVAAQGLWVALLSAVVAGALIHLPGAIMMQTFAILIALYIPVSLVIGWLVCEIAGAEDERTRQILVTIAVLALAVWGAWSLRNTAEPNSFALATRPDSRGMAWIREHTPEEARFLVEGFRIYEGTSIVGSDAGWWIPLLARRQNNMPPQYAILNEAPLQPDYSRRMVDLVKNLETISLDSTEGVHLLCDEGITHVYIGQGQGKVGSSATQLFSPAELTASDSFNMAYHQDRVYVFALKPEACRYQVEGSR